MRFHDRRDAGRVLARRLMPYAGRGDVVVAALPRGGVEVAYEVARALDAPLDVLVVRKLGVPGYEELAFGAIASGDVRVVNDTLVRALHIEDPVIDRIAHIEGAELTRRERVYRGGRPPLQVGSRTVIVVDDGLATGATMLAAVVALRKAGAEKIIVAVPVASRDACAALSEEVDMCVCLATPASFHGVGAWYDDFSQTSDERVTALLSAAPGQVDARMRMDSVAL